MEDILLLMFLKKTETRGRNKRSNILQHKLKSLKCHGQIPQLTEPQELSPRQTIKGK